MRTIIGWLAASICGGIGWWLGAKIGLAAAILLSAITGAAGLYAGYQWFDRNLR